MSESIEKEITKNYPEAFFIDQKKRHINIPVWEEISLDINYKRYPKRPKSNLINKKGDKFKLNTVINSLDQWNEKKPMSIVDLIDEIFLLINSLKSNQVLIKKDLIDGLIKMCKDSHPTKIRGILSADKGIVTEIIFPSRPCTSPGIYDSIFPTCSIPLNFSYEGTVITRPSGDLSVNEALGDVFKKRRFTMLIAHPYDGLDSIKCFDSNGNMQKIKIVE